MPDIDKGEPGNFCWMELSTSDRNAAKAFYHSLLGWEHTDSPMGPDQYYTMFTLKGRNAAAACDLQPDQAKQGIPPHWGLYISVASADDAVGRAANCGGKTFCPPFDVSTHGRMATIADPTGAVFSVWEARDHQGIGVSGQHGSFCWADLSTPDQPRAAQFYRDVFGWTMEPGESGYLHIVNSGHYIGGIPPARQGATGHPPHWLIHFQVDDCDAATAKARHLGARVFSGPMAIEHVGRMTVLADPQGAVFSLFQPFPRG